MKDFGSLLHCLMSPGMPPGPGVKRIKEKVVMESLEGKDE